MHTVRLPPHPRPPKKTKVRERNVVQHKLYVRGGEREQICSTTQTEWTVLLALFHQLTVFWHTLDLSVRSQNSYSHHTLSTIHWVVGPNSYCSSLTLQQTSFTVFLITHYLLFSEWQVQTLTVPAWLYSRHPSQSFSLHTIYCSVSGRSKLLLFQPDFTADILHSLSHYTLSTVQWVAGPNSYCSSLTLQ